MPRRNDIKKIPCAVITIALFIGFMVFASAVGMAQVDCVIPRKLTVSRVQGQVFDPTGIPIPGALISLMNEGTLASQTKTDETGRFRLDKASGSHIFKVEAPAFETATIELDIGRDAQSLLHPAYLRVILGFAGSFCRWITTSSRGFQQEIDSNKKRFQKETKTNAT